MKKDLLGPFGGVPPFINRGEIISLGKIGCFLFLLYLDTYMNVSILSKDVLAGLTTSFAAIALGAAFGVQSGRGALSGMISAAIIPIVTSLFGGTRLQASGPTAPMTAVSVLAVSYAYTEFGGQEDLAEQFVSLVIILSGLLMGVVGLFRLGNLITLVPQVVVIGFMNGIAVLIWWDQIQKLFGFGGVERISGDMWLNAFFAGITFIGILLFPYLLHFVRIPERVRPFLPGTLVVLIALTYIFLLSDLELQTVTLGSSVDSVSAFFALPMRFIPSGEILSLKYLWAALPFAFQLCLLGYLDSLLTSLVVDVQTQESSRKNKELLAQGGANIMSALFGGIPGAQATIRSVLLLKEGAQTRLAGVMVGVFTFLGIFLFQGVLSLVASSIFMGVLIKAGWDVFEKDYIQDFVTQKRFLQRNHFMQFALVLYTTLITVFFDLNIAVTTATCIFVILRRWGVIADITEISQTDDLRYEA